MSLEAESISNDRSSGLPIGVPVIACLVLLLSAVPTVAADDASPRIGAIEISGNDRTDESVILHALGLSVGDVFPEDRFDEIWDAVDDLGFFAFVDMDYEEDDAGEIILTIEVEEDKTSRLAPVLRYDRRFKYDLGASFAENNLRGKAETLEIAGTWHRTHSYRLAWSNPWAFRINGLTLAADTGWRNAPLVYRPTRFTSSTIGGSLRYRFQGSLFFEGDIHYTSFEQEDDFVWMTPDRDDGPSAPLLNTAGRRETLVLGAALGMDSRDSVFYPTTGFYDRLMVRVHDGRGFGSATIVIADLRAYLATPWEHVLALRAWGQIADAPLQMQDRLYLGGEESIRGYRHASLEGEEGWLLGAEYRWPLFLMPISPRGHVIGLGLHCFGDAGDAWYDGADSSRRSMSWGAGLNMSISSMQLRFEVAHTEDGETVFQFHDHFNF